MYEPFVISYVDPFSDRTRRRSVAWFNLRSLYLSNRTNLAIENQDEVLLTSIERNPADGGKWRWDTPLFDGEVTALMKRIKISGEFEAVWLQLKDGQLTVLDGHHRIVAWERLGFSAVPAVVVKVTPFATKFKSKQS
jgi:hypothetical protein